MGIELKNKAKTTGWFHLVSRAYFVRLKITNTEQTMPTIEQNMPHFIKEMEMHDKAAKAPKNKAKLVSSFPTLNFFITH